MVTKKETEFDLYQDICNRTNGEIYFGVVGPVRTGKSTFIKGFMEQMVLPYMEDSPEKERLIDELPQSAQGRTIMTTEPKFIPKEQATVEMNQLSFQVRLVDCVGYLIPGVQGYLEGEQDRMVKTPWFEKEIPFEQAARIGTEKVINEHATVGVVVTCDGTFGEIDRQAFQEAEEMAVKQLKMLKKPFVVVLNTRRPWSEETIELAKELEESYGCSVLPLNCAQLKREHIEKLLQELLYEFPVCKVDYEIPKWVEMLSYEDPLKQTLISFGKHQLEHIEKMKDVYQLVETEKDEGLEQVSLKEVSLKDGTVTYEITIAKEYYYGNISKIMGMDIQGEYQLLQVLREIAGVKRYYDQVASAMKGVEQKGYGVVMPSLKDIEMEEPILIRHGNKFGVKIKANSPSIHMIRANIETEIAPIVGNEEQAMDLITYIKESQSTKEGVFETNIFGKSIGELMEDGMRSKIATMDDECQIKLQDTMQKIVNENNGGLICFII